jgi:electron transfer flavoprotein beta subunit
VRIFGPDGHLILRDVNSAVDYAVKIRVNPQQTGIDTNVKHSMVKCPFSLEFFLCTSDVCVINRTLLTRLVRKKKKNQVLFQVHLLSLLLPAVEEAVRLRERLKDEIKSIKAITIGPPKSLDTLRTALAMGADSGIHVETSESQPAPEPLAIAKTLRAVIEREKGGVDLVILGKQAIDDDLGVTGQMLAGLMGWSQATFASKIEVDCAKKEVVVTREIDGGAEEVRCKLPLVVTTDLR